TDTQLQYTPDWTTNAGSALGGAAIPQEGQSGPLEASVGAATTLAGNNFFFDSGPQGQNLALKMGFRTAGNVANVIDMPDPFNAGGSSDYSIAIAGTTSRAWWMTTRNMTAQLVTVLFSGAVLNPNVVDVKVEPNGCDRLGADATPWV